MVCSMTGNGTSPREFTDAALSAATLVTLLAGCGTAKAAEVQGTCYHDLSRHMFRDRDVERWEGRQPRS